MSTHAIWVSGIVFGASITGLVVLASWWFDKERHQ